MVLPVCARCHFDFDERNHMRRLCTECKSDVCSSCGANYKLKSLGETVPRYICNVCEQVRRVLIGLSSLTVCCGCALRC